ncbi:hypothetical protein FHS31_002686 [Sphingomonas vulcanisoli]|uniref:Uncharacterized protein n=1 Tax=Sphingomonas vulcanisoli TaxID=1658060 RepID=A0ABX0TZJ9_9SPHN|nr:hypothetical protein [Sphingomonas vulcanisoli]NIJ09056.1 hypothetical protein [Sphingomonas vulcanisoli]
MGFSFTDSSPGLLGTVAIVLLIGVAVTVVVVMLRLGKMGRDDVVDGEGDHPDLLG